MTALPLPESVGVHPSEYERFLEQYAEATWCGQPIGDVPALADPEVRPGTLRVVLDGRSHDVGIYLPGWVRA